jgi:hypothetical protein
MAGPINNYLKLREPSKIGKMLIPPKIVNAVSTKSTAAIFFLSLPSAPVCFYLVIPKHDTFCTDNNLRPI